MHIHPRTPGGTETGRLRKTAPYGETTPLKAGPIHSVILTAAVLFASATAAEPYWVLLTDAPGRTPGDPVPAGAVERVCAAGGSIRTVSRYLNAVSVDFEGDPRALERLPGIVGVRPVRAMTRPRDIPAEPVGTRKTAAAGVYGLLAEELGMLGVPALNDHGYTGRGVKVGILDSGFDSYRTTGCLSGVNVAAARNFLRGGEDVSGDSHGTMVLACIAGNRPGEYRGPAPDAAFLLAVTDDPVTETRADEDRWVAGVEWCDSLGADIVSSSLVYNEFDNPGDNYTKDQMDGRTSLAARAAEVAFSRGILMVNAAGNEGNLPWRIITTPGDAEHVVAVGSVTVSLVLTPVIASFSSRGPTADGRIKPDVVAPGVLVDVPVPGESSRYTALSGTSLAAPFVTGLCALLVEARPGIAPGVLTAALKNTARDLGDPGPDNTYGWGLPDGSAALDSFPAAVAGGEGNAASGGGKPGVFRLLPPFPNPFNPRVSVPYRLDRDARVTVEVFDVTGRLVTVVADGRSSAGMHAVVWDARGCAAGVYLVRGRTEKTTDVRRIVLVK